MESYEDIILSDEPTPLYSVSNGGDWLNIMLKRYNGKTYIFAVNNTKEAKNTTVEVDGASSYGLVFEPLEVKILEVSQSDYLSPEAELKTIGFSNGTEIFPVADGGKEHYRYPSPYLQKVCRKIVDKGADLVVCQHSHCVGCQEEYKDRTIVYGQGNFVFSKNYDNEFWQTSVLVEVEIADTLKINYIPVCLHEQGTRIADETKANEIMEGFNRRSEEIKKPGFIYNTYKDFCFYNMKWYLYAISGGETNLKRSYAEYEPNYEITDCLLMINYLECEPHRELLTTLSHELAKEKLKENQ